jgi:hypothetical protein
MSEAEARSVHTSAPLGVHIILVERSQDESGVHLGSARCADCSSSEAEMSEAETQSVHTSDPLGVQIMLVERSRDDAFQASF